MSRGNRGLSDIQFRRTVRAVREAAGVTFFEHGNNGKLAPLREVEPLLTMLWKALCDQGWRDHT